MDYVQYSGEYYSEQNNSLSKKDVRSFQIKEVDPIYKKLLVEIAKRCMVKTYSCFFISQPTAYSKKITSKLKSLLWMTPPNEEYTLDLKSLIAISTLYNSELYKVATDHEIHFCDLAKHIAPSTAYFYDDVHFNENGSRKVSEILSLCVNEILAKNIN